MSMSNVSPALRMVVKAPFSSRPRYFVLSKFGFAAVVSLTLVGAWCGFYMLGHFIRTQYDQFTLASNLAEVTERKMQLRNLQDELAGVRSQLNSDSARINQYEKQLQVKVGSLTKILNNAGIVIDDRTRLAAARAEAALGGESVSCYREGSNYKCAPSPPSPPSRERADKPSRIIPEALVARKDNSAQIAAANRQQKLAGELAVLAHLLRVVPVGAPLSGFITSGYGIRISPFTHQPAMHTGVDIAAPFGSIVTSPGSGKVLYSGRHPAYGMTIEIQHTDGIVTRYAHLSRSFVREGQSVERGTEIGTVGVSGRSTGPHLHYEVLVDKQAKNPARFMELALKLKQLSLP